MSLFDVQPDPIERNEVFREDYLPAPLPVREEGVTRVQEGVRRALRQQTGAIVVRGPSGTGKTAIARRVVDADVDGSPDEWTYFEADPNNSSYREQIQFINRLRSGPPLSKTGYARDTVLTELARELETVVGPHGIAIDGATAATHETLIRALLSYVAETTTARIAVVVTTRQENASLIPEEYSVEEVTTFFSIDELMQILNHRIDCGCDAERISPEVVPLCAAYGIERGDYAHSMLDVFTRSAKVAQENLAPEVVGKHVEEAKTRLKDANLKSRVRTLDEHSVLVLYAAGELASTGRTPAASATLRTEYESWCASIPVEPLSRRRLRDRFRRLCDDGILTYEEVNEGRNGGRYREYSLVVPLERLQRSLEEATAFSEIHRTIQW